MLQHKPTYSVIQVDLPCIIYFSTMCGRQLADQEKLEYIIILSRHWVLSYVVWRQGQSGWKK